VGVSVIGLAVDDLLPVPDATAGEDGGDGGYGQAAWLRGAGEGRRFQGRSSSTTVTCIDLDPVDLQISPLGKVSALAL